nr:MAG TPA: hypothetical protein [Caudoviricetes sp.]
MAYQALNEVVFASHHRSFVCKVHQRLANSKDFVSKNLTCLNGL